MERWASERSVVPRDRYDRGRAPNRERRIGWGHAAPRVCDPQDSSRGPGSPDCPFALLMAAARRIPEAYDYVRQDRWKTWGPLLLLGPDVHHATLGIIGFGRIGREMAKRGRGFDMQVLYHDVYPASAEDEARL